MRLLTATLALACAALAAEATIFDGFVLPWTSAVSYSENRQSITYLLPTGPFRDGSVPYLEIDGSMERHVFRVDADVSTLDLFSAISDNLSSLGFAEIFRCQSRQCGGFDFRVAAGVTPPPDMFVDIGDFRFLSAWRLNASGPIFVDALVSRTKTSGFVQMTESAGNAQIGDLATNRKGGTGPATLPSAPEAVSVSEALTKAGSAVLENTDFASGSIELGSAATDELVDLSTFLKANPDLTVALVGHTDTEGTLEANIELSYNRADSVKQALVVVHGVDPAQLSAHGIGYLAPRATNSSPQGRMQNRRVEVVIVRNN